MALFRPRNAAEIRPPLFFTFLIKQQDGCLWLFLRGRFDHLVLTVADIKATCRFYQQVLGMTPFTFGNGRTALSFGNRKIIFMKCAIPSGPQLSGHGDLCFPTPVVEMLDHLKANGVPVEEAGAARRRTRPIVCP